MSRAKRAKVTSSDFVIVNREYAARIGNTPGVRSRHVRVFMLAMARLEPHGHAHFGQGELRELMAEVDRATGELTMPSRDAITRVIRALEADGVLMAGSWQRCLRVPPFDIEYARTDNLNTACPHKPPGRSTNLPNVA